MKYRDTDNHMVDALRYAFENRNYKPPTRWEKFKRRAHDRWWRVKDYFSVLWDALMGRL